MSISVSYPYEHVIPELQNWPIYKLAQNRTEFINEVTECTIERIFNDRKGGAISDKIAKVLYLERIRITQTPWKIDPPDELDFWNDIRQKLLKKSLDQTEDVVFENNKIILKRIINRYVTEITSNFKISTFRFARKALTRSFDLMLNVTNGNYFYRFVDGKHKLSDKLQISGAVDEVRALAKNGTLILVPTHYSNLDSLLLGWSADKIGIPAFSYGAGLNLYNNKIMVYYFGRLGAYTLDRRKKNKFYLEALKAYSQLTIEKGVDSLFYPGGTRSRSGALESKLKLGLLGTALDAQCAMLKRNNNTKVFVVPVTINYHTVLEAKSLIDQHLKKTGKEMYLQKKKGLSGFWSFVKFAWKFFGTTSEVILNFGKPLDVLGNFVDRDGNSLDQFGNKIEMREYFVSDGVVKYDWQRNNVYTQRLADKIVERFFEENVILSSNIIAFVAFEIFIQQYPGLDIYGLLRLPEDDRIIFKDTFWSNVEKLRQEILKKNAEGKVKVSKTVQDSSIDKLIEHGMRNLGSFHIKKVLTFDKDLDVVTEDMNLLYYYHNRLVGYNLEKYISIK